jgi:2-aminoadipate transaminase
MRGIVGGAQHEVAVEESASRPSEDLMVADWLRGSERSVLREMLATGARPEILTFALGLPATELLPRQAFFEALAETLRNDKLALQLGPPFHPLKQRIAELMLRRGVSCRAEQVFLTAGAQQALSLLARLLLDDGSQVIVEEVTYTGLHMAIQPHRPQVITVSTDPEQGIDIDEVEQLLAGGVRPAFIFAMSDGHNPLGISLPLRKRERLVEIARRYRVPVVEDDVYSFLSYHQPPAPPMRAFDDRWVLYVNSFSKLLGPGLRAGWMIVPEALIPRLSIIKDLSDIDSCTLTQRAIAAYLQSDQLDGHLASIRGEYKDRRDRMLRALEKHFTGVATWTTPTSGVFIWLRFTQGIDTAELLKLAVEREHVAFIPGKAFSAGGSDSANECLRLNFTYCQREQIEEGVFKLARAARDLMNKS